jgi:nucleoside-triphosphatase THEP1
MILVALTGPVGSGKTTLLSALADWAVENDTPIDGFLALPHDRRTANQGADEYHVHLLKSGRDLLFARRDPSLTPPYSINPETVNALENWAKALKGDRSRDLVLLDEFGPMEAKGGGHMALWPHLMAAHPAMVVIAVRDRMVREIERALEFPFDVVVDAASPTALEDLQSLVLHHSDWTRVGQFGAAAGGFEATVGSMLHQAKIPMAGLFLSTVQSLVMMYAGDRLSERPRVMWVPVISAGLKALSPYGGRLRPMLAITMQGFLFSLAVTVFGWNALGILVAGWCVGAWTALQGLVLQYLIIGDNLFPALDIVIRWVADHLHLALPGIVSFIFFWTVICGAISSIVTFAAWMRRHRLPARISAMLEKGSSGIVNTTAAPTFRAAAKRGLHDLLRPMFWAPVAVVALIIVAAGSTWEEALWMVMRALAVGWALFALARLFDPRKLVAWLRRRGHWGPAMALSRALRLHPAPTGDVRDDESQRGNAEHDQERNG